MKKILTLSVPIMAGLMLLGCAPSDEAPPAAETAPTPAEKIQDMDFESGDAEKTEEIEEEPETELTPDAQ
jgi:hypothetical protein